MNNRKWLIWVFAMMFATVVIVACQTQGTTSGGSKKSGTTLAKVGNEVITMEEFKEKLDKIPPFYKKRVASKKGKMEYLDRLVSEELYYQEAMAKGLDKDPEFLTQLESIKKSILAGKVKKDLMEAKTEVSDDQAKKYYQDNPTEYQTPETVTVKHILFRIKHGDSEDKKKEVKALADKVHQEIASKKITFDAAAEKYSDDKGSAKKGGKLPPIRKGLKSPEFDTAAFAMSKADEISKPFEDRRGYNILQFVEKSPAELKEYDKVEKQIKRKLQQDSQKTSMDTFTAELKKKYPVEIKEDLLKDEEGAEDAPAVPGMPQAGGEEEEGSQMPNKPGLMKLQPGAPGEKGAEAEGEDKE